MGWQLVYKHSYISIFPQTDWKHVSAPARCAFGSTLIFPWARQFWIEDCTTCMSIHVNWAPPESSKDSGVVFWSLERGKMPLLISWHISQFEASSGSGKLLEGPGMHSKARSPWMTQSEGFIGQSSWIQVPEIQYHQGIQERVLCGYWWPICTLLHIGAKGP